jgi:hypothetical protein
MQVRETRYALDCGLACSKDVELVTRRLRQVPLRCSLLPCAVWSAHSMLRFRSNHVRWSSALLSRASRKKIGNDNTLVNESTPQ